MANPSTKNQGMPAQNSSPMNTTHSPASISMVNPMRKLSPKSLPMPRCRMSESPVQAILLDYTTARGVCGLAHRRLNKLNKYVVGTFDVR